MTTQNNEEDGGGGKIPAVSGVFDEHIAHLASLPPFEYEKVRKRAAERLGIRATALDRLVKEAHRKKDKALKLPEPEPWPDPVDGDDLLDQLVVALRRYLVLVPHAAEAMALWIVHCHAVDAAQVAPRLALTSPEMRCGKTTCLTILSRLVPRPLMTSNISAAAIYRTVEAAKPILLIDEADTFMQDAGELRGILNSGHAKAMAYVVRVEGDNHAPRAFATWAPVAIAKIGKLPPTLADRSIRIEFKRKSSSERVERLRIDRLDHLNELASMAARWAQDNVPRLAKADPEMPDALNDRGQDNWRPLIAIADACGGNWPDKVRLAALGLSGNGNEVVSSRVELLADIKRIFDARGTERLFSETICNELARMEERPWPEWRNGRPITQRQLARQLEPFGIKPKTVWIDDRSAKGYELTWFEDAFARYLGFRSVNPSDSNDFNGLSESSPVRRDIT